MHGSKHISEVCKMLEITSRTVRYYEQLGLIQTERETPTAPRRLNAENIEQLRKILFLRKIGLSLDDILAVCKEQTNVQELIRTKTVSLRAEISALRRRIRLLETVVKAAEQNEDIYAVELEMNTDAQDAANCQTAATCIRLMRERDFTGILDYFAPEVRKHMTTDMLAYIWDEFIKSCGAYVSDAKQTKDENIIRNYLHFEKKGGIINFVFRDDKISGIMMEYWNEKE